MTVGASTAAPLGRNDSYGDAQPPNPRWVLTGAWARRSRARYILLWDARLRRTPRQQKRRALGGNLISSFSTTELVVGPPRPRSSPRRAALGCLGSRCQRPARDTVRAAAEFRATGISAPRGRRGPAVRGVYFSWPPAAGAPGGAPGGHPNRGAPLAARAVPHGARSAGGSGRGSPQGGDGASVGRARPRHGSMGGPPRGGGGPAAAGSPPT